MHESPIIDIGGFRLDLSVVIMLAVTSLIVFVIARLSVRKLSVESPSGLQNFMEWAVEFIRNTIASTMPMKYGKAFVSLGMTLIIFIFVGNILGLPFAVITEHDKPVEAIATANSAVFEELKAEGEEHPHVGLLWWKSPTADLGVTFGLALVVFVIVHYLGLTRNRKHYLKHYFHPYWFFLPLNIIETIAKPATLGMRLFANIFAGEILISTIIKAGFYGIPLLVVWQGFSVFIGAIQAFLFTILTMVYIAQAAVHEEH
ncbi:F0F1 ATP synthase subunit A [Paenibacillus oceani]|uniref:ATP synthase subunit a n=1 Tax=Paenibacillus oceani TaxID=2772510 RepID=A0A927H1L3_9BACL|nr:F0F1 ATP synthase subunit A [Paenibacillus oceani]MBD2863584.1 F0F1 ATP synthase subunit A [Paenibacillus oceani]